METTVSAADFKNHCLRIMNRVKASGLGITVTKRGKPVVRILPAPDLDVEDDMEGLILRQARDLTSTGERWEADR